MSAEEPIIDFKETAENILENYPEARAYADSVIKDPVALKEHMEFIPNVLKMMQNGGKRKRKKRKKSRKRRKGGKCEYKKVAGKWKNVCTTTKKNFSIKPKSSLRHSKAMYQARKKYANKPITKRATGDKSSKLTTLPMPMEEPLPSSGPACPPCSCIDKFGNTIDAYEYKKLQNMVEYLRKKAFAGGRKKSRKKGKRKTRKRKKRRKRKTKK